MKNIILALTFALLAVGAHADSDTRASLDRGTYIQTASISGSSWTGTAFVSINPVRMDGVYFNNTDSYIWIGTTTVGALGIHENHRIGLPIASSATFKLDGVMSGAVNFTCTAGVAICEVRAFEGLNR